MSSEVILGKCEAEELLELTVPAIDGGWEGGSTFVMLIGGHGVGALSCALGYRVSLCCSSATSCFWISLGTSS